MNENKYLSFNYDTTKGVIIGLAASLVLNYLNSERISMIVENITNYLKNKEFIKETNEQHEKK
ncbi:2082_t:CDS:1, partial [Cetraspora pellucida]